MTNEEREILVPLRLDIHNKTMLLERARNLGAQPNVLIAIRRKIYAAQDLLIEQAVKLKITLPRNWFK